MEPSTPKKNLSATAAPSFVLDGKPPNPALERLRIRLESVKRELTDLEMLPMPVPKLYIKARNANISRMKTEITDILEAIAYEEKQTQV